MRSMGVACFLIKLTFKTSVQMKHPTNLIYLIVFGTLCLLFCSFTKIGPLTVIIVKEKIPYSQVFSENTNPIEMIIDLDYLCLDDDTPSNKDNTPSAHFDASLPTVERTDQ